jgi:hypothetical protein
MKVMDGGMRVLSKDTLPLSAVVGSAGSRRLEDGCRELKE